MSYAISSNTRTALLAVCMVSLAPIGACGQSGSPETGPAAGRAARTDSSSRDLGPVRPPAWYKGNAPVIRHQSDATRKRDWVLAWDGVHAHDQGSGQRSGRIALPGWIWVGKPYGCAPALAIGPRGEALVTSDVAPLIWRIDPATFAVTRSELRLDADAARDIGFSGLVYAPEQGVFVASSAFHGSFWRVDPGLATARKVTLSARLPRACGWDISPPMADPGNDRGLSLCISSDAGFRLLRLAPDLRSADVVVRSCASHG